MRDDVKATIYVDLDWSSTGIWIAETGRYANAAYESFDLPQWLVERFEYWTWWYNRFTPWAGRANEPDWDDFSAYGRSLAIDLKLVLGAEYEVRYGRDEIITPVPRTPEELEQTPTKQRKEPRPTLFETLRLRTNPK